MTKTRCFNFGQTFSPSLARASELPGVFIQMQIPGSHARANESDFWKWTQECIISISWFVSACKILCTQKSNSDTTEVGESLVLMRTVIDLISNDSARIHCAMLAIHLCHKVMGDTRESVSGPTWSIWATAAGQNKQTTPVQMAGM